MPVTATSPSSSTGGVSAPATASKTSNPKSQLKVEDFIKMMVTQLQNQDPMEPAKNEAILAQMSQIGQLQSQQELQTSLKTLVLQNNLGAAGNLIGKVVKGSDALTGEEVLGQVMSVKVVKGEVSLELDSGKQMSLSKVSEIMTGGSNTGGTKVATP